MTVGQRVVWLRPLKVGWVETVDSAARTVDLRLEGGATRGRVPIAEVVAVSHEGPIQLPTLAPPSAAGAVRPIASQEGFGTPSLG